MSRAVLNMLYERTYMKQYDDDADTLHSEEPITEIPTQDIALAAFLSLKYPILSIGGEPGGKRTFWFPAEAAKDERAFYQGRALADPRAVCRALRDLKSRLDLPAARRGRR
jgi:hypothetical protein